MVLAQLPDVIEGFVRLPGDNKIRGLYDLGDGTSKTSGRALMVTTDLISALDHVFANPIPMKGFALTQHSAVAFKKPYMRPNHMRGQYLGLVTPETEIKLLGKRIPPEFHFRSMVVTIADPIRIEAIMRGFLLGSALREYDEYGTVGGQKMPKGLKRGDKFKQPVFAPTTKALKGEHDRPISLLQVGVYAGGYDAAVRLRDLTRIRYLNARDDFEARGLVLADTKFEWGWIRVRHSIVPQLVTIDEAFTPDSSRIVREDEWNAGNFGNTLDKDRVRKYLQDQIDRNLWHPEDGPPVLPDHLVMEMTTVYTEAFRLFAGEELRV